MPRKKDITLPFDDKFQEFLDTKPRGEGGWKNTYGEWQKVSLENCRSHMWNSDCIFRTKLSEEIVSDWMSAITSIFPVKPFYTLHETPGYRNLRIRYDLARMGPSFGQMCAYLTMSDFPKYYKLYKEMIKQGLKPYQAMALIPRTPQYAKLNMVGNMYRFPITQGVSSFPIVNFDWKGPNMSLYNPGSSIEKHMIPITLDAHNGIPLQVHPALENKKGFVDMYVELVKSFIARIKIQTVFSAHKYTGGGLRGETIEKKLSNSKLSNLAPYINKIGGLGAYNFNYTACGRRLDLKFKIKDLALLPVTYGIMYHGLKDELAQFKKIKAP